MFKCGDFSQKLTRVKIVLNKGMMLKRFVFSSVEDDVGAGSEKKPGTFS